MFATSEFETVMTLESSSSFQRDSDSEKHRVSRQVYVLDDEKAVLDVLEMQLKVAGYAVATFSDPSDFLKQVASLDRGVVITDQRMPGYNGLKVQQHLQAYTANFRLILLSGYPETRVVVEAMKHGAITVLDKPYQRDVLLQAVEEAFESLDRVTHDDTRLPPVLPNGARYIDRLSARERQVIEHVYGGETNKSIAIQLAISIKTVEKHRGKAMRKMQVTSMAELIRLMERENDHH
ncbi:MAG: response regulator transcription factor [Planctomycetaceae bacterium]|nr:response regulator transcription factor [Planctomycetaceae bacterium]